MSEESLETKGEAFEAGGNDTLVSLSLMVSILLLLGSVMLLLRGLFGPTPPYQELGQTFWGLLGTLNFGWATFWSFRFLFDREPRLRISAEGILNRTYWASPIQIPWVEVIDIRTGGFPGIREIVLRDPSTWLAEQPRAVRASARLTRLFGLGPVAVNLWALDATWAAVDEQLEFRFEKFELGSYGVGQVGSERGGPPSIRSAGARAPLRQ